MGLLKNLKSKVSNLSKGSKIALGVAGASAAVGAGYLAYKALRAGKRRKVSNERLRNKVERNILKIKQIQTQRKLFKDKLKFQVKKKWKKS